MSYEYDTYQVDASDKKITGMTFIKKLAKALGINFPVRRILIDAKIDDVQTIVIESIMRNEQGDKVAFMMSEEFELHKKSDSKRPISLDEVYAYYVESD